MSTIYGVSVEKLHPVSYFKEKNVQWYKAISADKKFVVKYSEEYCGDGIHKNVSIWWRNVIPLYLNAEQKSILARSVANIHFSQ